MAIAEKPLWLPKNLSFARVQEQRLSSVDLHQSSPARGPHSAALGRSSIREEHAMLRCILAALAALVLVTVSLIPDDAYARGGRGGGRGGGGGFHGAAGMRGGGGMHAGRISAGRVSAGRVYGGGRYAGRARPSHPIAGRPIAGRPGYPGRPIAGRPGYPGYGGGYYRPGLGYGAAVGVGAAAAAGAYYGSGYYGNSGCYYDQYGQYLCPQYPSQGYYNQY